MFYYRFMPRKTFVLISGLVVVTLILFIVALNSNNKKIPPATTSQKEISMQAQVSPTVPAHSVLSLFPNPVNVVAGQKGSVDVNIDTSDNNVTAVQLEIAYDPTYITNIKVTPGTLFSNPVVLFDKNNIKDGRLTYMYGIAPSGQTVKGSGIAATISFTALNKTGDTQLALLPTSLVTARGISDSVLKQASGTLIKITSAAAAQGATTNTNNESSMTVSGTPR
jgi:hypothetical protein